MSHQLPTSVVRDNDAVGALPNRNCSIFFMHDPLDDQPSVPTIAYSLKVVPIEVVAFSKVAHDIR